MVFRGGGWQVGRGGLGVIARAAEVCRSALKPKYVSCGQRRKEARAVGDVIGRGRECVGYAGLLV